MNSSRENAVILAAGLGSRLMPLTKDRPKCMVELFGQPILIRMLDQLQAVGIRHVSIVCGYRADVLRKTIGRSFHGIQVKYVENEKYAQTNSMYSLWMAMSLLEQGGYIVEGDSICDQRLLENLARRESDTAYWAGRRYHGEIDGCVLTASGPQRRIVRQEIIRNPSPGEKPDQYKSTGILAVSADFGRALAQWLDDDVRRGNVDIYYDLVIGKHLSETPIHIFDIGSLPWFEVDTKEDLHEAERLFAGDKAA